MTWGVILAMTTVAAVTGSVEGQLTGAAAELYRKAQSGHFWEQASRLKYELMPTSDGRSFIVVYRAVPAPTHWIVSSHGTQGFATDDCALWAQGAGSRDVGVVCVQWWLGTAGPAAYYEPGQEYREIDRALTVLGVKPGTVMYHGFSRGSANSYAVVAFDQGRRKQTKVRPVVDPAGSQLRHHKLPEERARLLVEA